jgi:hypothetical protein
MTDVKDQKDRKVEFAFDTAKEIEVAKASYAWECCGMLPFNAEVAIENRARSRTAWIRNGVLFYSVDTAQNPSPWSNSHPKHTVETILLSSIGTLETSEPCCCCGCCCCTTPEQRAVTWCTGWCDCCACPGCLAWACVDNPLLYVRVHGDDSVNALCRMKIYGLNDPRAFISKVHEMVRDERDAKTDRASAIAAASVMDAATRLITAQTRQHETRLAVESSDVSDTRVN